MKFLPELITRLTSETPLFFRKLQIFGGSIAAIGTSLAAIGGMPATIISISEHAIWIGGVIVAVSQAACKNTPDAKP